MHIYPPQRMVNIMSSKFSRITVNHLDLYIPLYWKTLFFTTVSNVFDSFPYALPSLASEIFPCSLHPRHFLAVWGSRPRRGLPYDHWNRRTEFVGLFFHSAFRHFHVASNLARLWLWRVDRSYQLKLFAECPQKELLALLPGLRTALVL